MFFSNNKEVTIDPHMHHKRETLLPELHQEASMVNANLKEQRLCIKISVKKGHTLKKAVEDCRTTYGEACGSYYFIRHWFKRFELGRNSVDENELRGQRFGEREEVVEAVHKALKDLYGNGNATGLSRLAFPM
ncbi:unnamed protein product [Owenia fusiformis]|uniref:Uncharacterized protein n=1 Tax=Owenia fusiformis TaxID=6347 RepID=A0A8J1XLL6_OWEFU|nr:unnamed protein product [Owenia fusiformis]